MHKIKIWRVVCQEVQERAYFTASLHRLGNIWL